MYSNSKFSKAKTDLANSLLHLRNPGDAIQQVQDAFLRHLLTTVAERAYASRDDVQSAIEASGVFDIAPEIVTKLYAIGDNYLGALSADQARILRKVRELCLRYVERNEIGALTLLADII